MAEKLKDYDVVVKFKHLDPELQKIIGTVNENIISTTIRGNRKNRAFVETTTLVNLIYGLLLFNPKVSPVAKTAATVSFYGSSFTAAGRILIAKIIQKRHKELAEKMKNFGLLQTKFEGKYPRDWINSTTIEKTHPVFYVKRNGDLVFPKMTRTEYARYVFQKRFPGKLGLNIWRWRAILKKPEAPEKISDLVNRKIDGWLAAVTRKPAFGIATVNTTKKRAKRKTRRI